MSSAREVAGEIAGQALDFRAGDELVNHAHGVGEDRRAAVGEVVAVDRGQHEVLPAELGDGFGDALGLEPIDFALRAAGLDVAEAAAARARVAEDHDRRGAGAPALADVRAHRLLADRVQVERLDVPRTFS